MRGKTLAGILGAAVLVGLAGAAFASEGAVHHELNWYDFSLRVLNFVILLAILIKLLKKPLMGFLTSRREGIEKTLADLDQKRREAEEKAALYKGRLAALDEETGKIVAEYIQEGEQEKAKIIESARRQAEYLKEQARLAIQQEMKAAREDLQAEIVDLSVSAAEEILKKNIQLDDQKRLIHDFMAKVGEAK